MERIASSEYVTRYSNPLIHGAPASVQSLNPDAVLDLGHAICFDSASWVGKSLSDEQDALSAAGYNYTILDRHSLVTPGALDRVVDKYGVTKIVKRLLTFITKPEYLEGPLGAYQPALIQIFCGVEVVRRRFLSEKGHVKTMQMAWSKLRPHTTDHTLGVGDFGPRRCLILLYR